MRRVTIRAMQADDWPQVESIYREGLNSGNASFESTTPTWEEFDVAKVDVRLVAVEGDAVLGWAAGSPASTRSVYQGVIENSVYVASAAAGRGIGFALLEAFLKAAEDAGYWMVQSSIFAENAASISLHEKAGFRIVGRRERIALMTYGPYAGTWRDTVLVEWRSQVQGR